MSTRAIRSFALKTVGALCAAYLVLLVPEPPHKAPGHASNRPFVWNQDSRWDALERKFTEARSLGCGRLSGPITDTIDHGSTLIERIDAGNHSPGDTLFGLIEENAFSLGPMVGACPVFLPRYLRLVTKVRQSIKEQAASWDMNSVEVRNRLYRLLYGTRAAVEEVMLQESPDSLPSSILCYDEPSATPAASILGMQVHSGDILVSRGGAPASALIARGNDYPGNFSHVALVHVDSLTGKVSVIESHIERGVAIAGIADYLRDTKLRVMILRLRSDLAAMKDDPLLPHRAASWTLRTALSRHIPYDFSMDLKDTSRWFCSEVVSSAYNSVGVRLWMGLSTISSPGVSSWLSAFGVEHFETKEPSDLEYDPQLRVVAEWRDRGALFNDHVDNAVIDAMLEGAERGDRLGYAWYTLPLARIAKGYSWLMERFGGVGPVPEGMSATAASIVKRFVARHAAMKLEVLQRAAEFRARRGYTAPYWELLRFARGAAEIFQ